MSYQRKLACRLKTKCERAHDGVPIGHGVGEMRSTACTKKGKVSIEEVK